MSDTRIRLLEGNILRFEARLASAAKGDKDRLRRAIKACKDQLRMLRAAENGDTS